MDDGLEAEPCGGFGKDEPGEPCAVRAPVGCEESGTERVFDRLRRLAARGVEPVYEVVRVDDVRSELGEERSEETFAAGDAAGQGKRVHSDVRCDGRHSSRRARPVSTLHPAGAFC